MSLASHISQAFPPNHTFDKHGFILFTFKEFKDLKIKRIGTIPILLKQIQFNKY